MEIRSKRHSKKAKITKEPKSLPVITKKPKSLPPDLLIEILKRLPVKLVARCLLVSKLWATIIRSQDFNRSFSLPSLQPQQIRFLFPVNDYSNWYFYLSSSTPREHHHALSPLSLTQCNIPERLRCCLSDVHYVNGLISLGYSHQQIIVNPSTGKSIHLPTVKTTMKSSKQIIKSYFGFDPVDFQYKLLCMSESSCSDHQVITVGGREKQSWRMIECNTPHCPKTNSVCIDGVLYYGAFTTEWCIMRFDVRTEKLDFCSRLNENVECFRLENPPCLINYQGKVALASETSLNTFDLWVMEDAQKWSKVHLAIDPWLRAIAPWMLREDLREHNALYIRGILHTGEIVFVSGTQLRGEGAGRASYLFFYNLKDNILGQIWFRLEPRFNFRLLYNPWFSLVVPFLDYVSSAMLL